jgi:hypothetical protein
MMKSEPTGEHRAGLGLRQPSVSSGVSQPRSLSRTTAQAATDSSQSGPLRTPSRLNASRHPFMHVPAILPPGNTYTLRFAPSN